MRKLLLVSLSFLAMLLLAVPSYAVVVDLNLLTPNASQNKIAVNAWVKYNIPFIGEVSDSDSDTANATGNIVANLDYDFDPNDTSVATLKTVDFNDGSFDISDISMSLVHGAASANSHNLGGTLDTKSPPASVTNGPNAQTKYIDAANHKATINQGTISFSVPITSIPDMNFAAEPASGTPQGQGSITTTLHSTSGDDYTYKVRLEMPMEVTETGSYSGANYGMTVTGNLVAEGFFTQTIATVPEPSSLALLLGTIISLLLIRRKR